MFAQPLMVILHWWKYSALVKGILYARVSRLVVDKGPLVMIKDSNTLLRPNAINIFYSHNASILVQSSSYGYTF